MMVAFIAAMALAPVHGSVDPHLTANVLCGTSFRTGLYRHVSLSEKRAVCARDHAKNCPSGAWEIDHDISLEVGGDNSMDNLWAQRIDQARIKDKLENQLHRLVCAGKITLPTAQKCIAANWVKCYDRYMR